MSTAGGRSRRRAGARRQARVAAAPLRRRPDARSRWPRSPTCKRLCETHLAGRYEIEVIDLLVNPKLAAGDQILAVPTLVRKFPEPIRKIIGDLSNEERVLVGLDVKPLPERHGRRSIERGPASALVLSPLRQPATRRARRGRSSTPGASAKRTWPGRYRARRSIDLSLHADAGGAAPDHRRADAGARGCRCRSAASSATCRDTERLLAGLDLVAVGRA